MKPAASEHGGTAGGVSDPPVIVAGAGNPLARQHTYGLDLAGQSGSANSLEGAGTIGGILAVKQAVEGGGGSAGVPPASVDAGEYLYCYDGNGNVGQLVAWAADFGGADGFGWDDPPPGGTCTNCRLVAAYEYDPYGNTIAAAGGYAAVNPFRFSTKRYDPETGLLYYGYRYYDPQLGRWISRDPIGEVGGLNVYAFVLNNAIWRIDARGESGCCPDLCTCGDRKLTLGPVKLDAVGGGGKEALDALATLGYISVAYDIATKSWLAAGWDAAMTSGGVPDLVVDAWIAVWRKTLVPQLWIYVDKRKCENESCWLIFTRCNWKQETKGWKPCGLLPGFPGEKLGKSALQKAVGTCIKQALDTYAPGWRSEKTRP